MSLDKTCTSVCTQKRVKMKLIGTSPHASSQLPVRAKAFHFANLPHAQGSIAIASPACSRVASRPKRVRPRIATPHHGCCARSGSGTRLCTGSPLTLAHTVANSRAAPV